MGRPLLPYDEARGVGQTGDNAIARATRTKPPERKGKLVKAQEAAREAVCGAQRAASKDPSRLPRVAAAEAAGRAAVAKVLVAPVDLKLPNATVGAKRKRYAAAEAAQAARAASEPTLAGLEQAVSRRKAALVAAMQAQAADSAQLERAEQQLDAFEDCGFEKLDDPAYLAAERAYTAASAAWTQSERKLWGARVFWLAAELKLCQERCARLQTRNEHLEAVVESNM